MSSLRPSLVSIANFARRVLTDAAFALRLLRRSPGFAVTLLGVLIVGVGATTAMFSLVMSLLVRPLPYPRAEELTAIRTTERMRDSSETSLADFLDWKAQSVAFASMAATKWFGYGLSSAGEKPESLHGAAVSGEFFTVLGIAPLRGRLLGPDDDRVSAPRVAVISAAVWHRRFGSDPGVVGRAVVMNGDTYTVVGIAPEGFRYSTPYVDRADVWTPLASTLRSYTESTTERGGRFLYVIGRRAPGVSLAEAQAELGGIAANLATKYPESNTGTGVRVMDLQAALVASSREDIWVLFAAVGLVFLVICANVANLLLARASTRRAEMAARAALGATRGRIALQLVTETVVVFSLGGLGGAAVATWLVRFFASGLVRGAASTIDVRVDGTALAFGIGVAALSGLVFGLVPAAAASRVSPHTVLKESGARASAGRAQEALRGALVVVQVALALALLVGSGLALRAYGRLASTPPGFDADNVVTGWVLLPADKYKDDDKRLAFFRDVVARIAAQPSVTSVAANTQMPMSGSSSWSGFAIEGRPFWRAGEKPSLQENVVTPGYFRTMGIPLLRGRDFTDADVKGGRRVMIISAETAARFFPGEEAIGHRIDWGNSDAEGEHTWLEIVGIVGSVRHRGLAEGFRFDGYVPVAQNAPLWTGLAIRAARTDEVLQALPGIVASVDPEQAVDSARLLRDDVAASIEAQRYATQLLGAFALAALCLATLGIFGLVSYTTGQRTRELGIRLALGSSPERVIAVVMREGVLLLGTGLLVGAVGAVFVGRAISARVLGAVAFDPIVFASIFGILGLAGTLASFLPALRAVRISPAAALRYE
jgi:putative ABC transport system permease protein